MTISVNLKGRLGNQLFQYATLRNLSIKKGYNFYIDTNFKHQGQSNLLNLFNISESSPPIQFKYTYYQPSNSNFFDSNIYDINDDTLLDGHFENVDFFCENREIIKNELTLKDDNINDFVDKYINEIAFDKSKIVGIHFRRGDLVQQLDLHPNFRTVDNFNEITKKYVYESLETILNTEKKITLLIFTGGVRKEGGSDTWFTHSHDDDLLWIQNFVLENKLNFNMHISPGTIENNELIDFSLIQKCDYVITPFQSTFSFMAYYFGKKNNKLFSPTNLYGGI